MSRNTLPSLLLCPVLLLASGCTSDDEDGPPALYVVTDTLPGGVVGVAYSETLQATGGVTPYTWSVSAGTLPGGLTLNVTTGEISGTPTTFETASFTVTVSDGEPQNASKALTLNVTSLTPVILTTSLADGTTGGAYSETITAGGGVTPYTWSLFSGTAPAGLTLNASLGQILGSPTTPGTSNFTVRVTDANTATDDQALSITINPPPTITTASLPKGFVGTAYSQTLAATGGSAPLVWAVVLGAPPAGLFMSTGGTISGTPTASGTSNFTARVADNCGVFDDQALTLVVEDPLVITTTVLPDGRVGTAYSRTLAATGGVPGYTWTILSGGLPAGLTLTAATGVISGTPTGAGTANFTVQCADSGTQTDTQALSIKIDPTTFPRLVVANAGTSAGVKIWDNVDSITADQASNATLGGLTSDGAIGLALDGNRLFVASDSATDPVYIWDNASTLANGTVNTTTLLVSAFASTPISVVYDMFVDGNGDFWIDYGYIRLFLGASTLNNGSTSQAQFTHQWGAQIYAMASDTTGNKLIGGQVSGAGAVCWNAPTAKTGETNAEDWTLQALGTPSHMTIAGNRLYMGSFSLIGGAGYMNIWDNIGSLTAGTAPAAVMGAGSSLGTVSHVQVKNDFLVVTVNDPPIYQVNIYANASGITGDTAPAFQITDGSMVLPVKSHLANDGRLYVLDQNGILIFRGATSAPAFLCEITTDISGARDFLIME